MSGLTWLRASVSTQLDRAIVSLVGDLDVASSGPLGDELAYLVDKGSTRIVVDLADLAFCDASGLGILVKAAVRTVQRGGWLRIADAGPLIDKIIDITRLTRVLPAYRTVEEALAGGAGAVRGIADG